MSHPRCFCGELYPEPWPGVLQLRCSNCGAGLSSSSSPRAALLRVLQGGRGVGDPAVSGSAPASAAAAAVAPRDPERPDPLNLIEFEASGVHPSTKARLVRQRFGISLTRYYQLLHRALDDPAMFVASPELVRGLRAERAKRVGLRLVGHRSPVEDVS